MNELRENLRYILLKWMKWGKACGRKKSNQVAKKDTGNSLKSKSKTCQKSYFFNFNMQIRVLCLYNSYNKSNVQVVCLVFQVQVKNFDLRKLSTPCVKNSFSVKELVWGELGAIFILKYEVWMRSDHRGNVGRVK